MDEFDEVPDLIPDLIEIDAPQPAAENPSPQPPAEALPTLSSIGKPPSRRVVPLTILTGWLGSGKTTLLHNLLDTISSQGKTMAILQNETSELMGVEKALRLQDDSGVFGQVLEIKNGCVCCSVKSDFLLAIDTLLEKASFDYVVVECSGIADVGSLATRLWVDDDQEARVYLDGIVCVVDAAHIHRHMGWKSPIPSSTHSSTTVSVASDKDASDEPPKRAGVVYSQLIHADTVLLNKVDTIMNTTESKKTIDMDDVRSSLVALKASLPDGVSLASHLQVTETANQKKLSSTSDLSKSDLLLSDICQNVRKVNPSAPIVLTTQSKVDISRILDLKAFRLGHHNVSCIDDMSKSKKTSGKIHMSSVRGTDMSELEPITIPVQSGTVLLYTAHHTLRQDALKMTSNTSTSTDMTDHHHPHPHMHIVDDSVHHTHAHTHDTAPAPASSDLDHGIATIVLRSSTVSLQKVKHWLVELLWGRRQAESVQGWRELRERLREGETEVDDRVVEDQGMDIFRIKGVLSIYDKDEKYYLQGVMDTFDLAPADCTVGIDIKDDNIDRTELDQDGLRIKKNFAQSRRNSGDVWQEGEERHSSIIIIGVDLDINMIVSGFAQCLEE